MCMINISNKAMNTLISHVPCFSFASRLVHAFRSSGFSCPFAVLPCFKERQFTLWAMQLGRLLLFYFLCPSSCSICSLSSFWDLFLFLLPSMHPLPLFLPYFLGSVYNKGKQQRRKQIRCSLCKTAEGEDVR